MFGKISQAGRQTNSFDAPLAEKRTSRSNLCWTSSWRKHSLQGKAHRAATLRLPHASSAWSEVFKTKCFYQTLRQNSGNVFNTSRMAHSVPTSTQVIKRSFEYASRDQTKQGVSFLFRTTGARRAPYNRIGWKRLQRIY